jgi:hypothetical protein
MKFRSVHISLFGKCVDSLAKDSSEKKLSYAIIYDGSMWATKRFSLPVTSYDELRKEIKQTGKSDIFEAFAYALISMIKKEYGSAKKYDFTKAIVDANIGGKKYSKTIPIVSSMEDKIHNDVKSEFDLYNDFDGEESIKESKTNKNMKKNIVKINENTLRKMVAESVKKVLKEGVGTPKLTMAYKNLVDCIYTIVLERAKISMGQNGLETTIDAVDSMETFKQDVKEYTEKYIYPQINKVYDIMISNYDMLGGMDYAKENGEGIGDRNWK